MSSEYRNRSIKEELGFVEGIDVEVYLHADASNATERLGYLRPEYGDTPRLYERFELELSDPAGRTVYVGQKQGDPFVFRLEPGDERDTFVALVSNEALEGKAVLSLVSRYNPEDFVLTVELRRSERGRPPAGTDGLPEAWRKRDSSTDGTPGATP